MDGLLDYLDSWSVMMVDDGSLLIKMYECLVGTKKGWLMMIIRNGQLMVLEYSEITLVQ